MSSSQWQEYLEYYHEQRRLEKYQQERVLPRPKTTKPAVIVCGAWLLVGLAAAVWLPLLCLPFSAGGKLLVALAAITAVAESMGRLLGIKIVECYQHYAPEETRRRCKCVPSCSEYAVLCFRKYPLIYALLKIRKRLYVTCQGFDYIIDEP